MFADVTQDAAERELYRDMMCSQGGLVLRIRLRAQLDAHPLDELEAMALAGDLGRLRHEPGFGTTLDWLERKFGRANAVRALRQTVEEIAAAYAG
jgi:hypothetical protein